MGFILSGLLARYVFQRKRLSIILFALTPVIDLLLLTATVIDLKSGGIPSFAHGLAAVYIGISIAFGHQMIQWADYRFSR